LIRQLEHFYLVVYCESIVIYGCFFSITEKLLKANCQYIKNQSFLQNCRSTGQSL